MLIDHIFISFFGACDENSFGYQEFLFSFYRLGMRNDIPYTFEVERVNREGELCRINMDIIFSGLVEIDAIRCTSNFNIFEGTVSILLYRNNILLLRRELLINEGQFKFMSNLTNNRNGFITRKRFL